MVDFDNIETGDVIVYLFRGKFAGKPKDEKDTLLIAKVIRTEANRIDVKDLVNFNDDEMLDADYYILKTSTIAEVVEVVKPKQIVYYKKEYDFPVMFPHHYI